MYLALISDIYSRFLSDVSDELEDFVRVEFSHDCPMNLSVNCLSHFKQDRVRTGGGKFTINSIFKTKAADNIV